MKSAFSPVCRVAMVATACLLTQCAMPPRDAWRIVQTEGLVPYLTGNFQTASSPNRYLSMSAPLQRNTQAFPSVPYRPSNHTSPSRYLADDTSDETPAYTPPYRPRTTRNSVPKKSQPRRDEDTAEVATKREPKKSDSLVTSKKDKPIDAPSKLSLEDLPYGVPVGGRPGMVNSPFATKDQLVDVTGMSVGETVKCPYSGKLFRVPPTQQAASKSKDTTPAPEPPEEPAKTNVEPKSSPEPKSPPPEVTPAPAPDKPAADPAKPAADGSAPKS